MGINWQQFGLRGNPYSTNPLTEGGDMPIEKVFVGRSNERRVLDDFLAMEEGGCITVCGKAGVGKTSLINFEKYLFKNPPDQRPLFSFRREIEASLPMLNKRNFLLELIGSIIREIKLIDPALVETDPLLKKIQSVVDIVHSMDISAGLTIAGFGVQAGGSHSSWQPSQLPLATVEQYFFDLVDLIVNKDILLRGYRGIIVHVNNFDVVCCMPENRKAIISFFGEVRDLLQTSKVFFTFLGPRNFFKDIISAESRVKAIFQQVPILIDPLSKTEIIHAISERLSLLKLGDVGAIIKPFEDEVVDRLYDLYEGDIRSIMSAMRAILWSQGDKLTDTIGVDEAMILLGRERLSRVEKQLTEEKMKVLWHIVQAGEPISQKQVADLLKKEPANVSGYYFAPLKEMGIIEETGRHGNEKFWQLTTEFQCLKFIPEAQKNVEQQARHRVEQLSLFQK